MGLRSLKNILLISGIILFTNLKLLADAKFRNDNGVRIFVPMNFGWKFIYCGEDLSDASKWIDVDLPHDFQISQEWIEPDPDEQADFDNPMANIKSRLSARGFKEMGTGFYRKTFVPDKTWKGKRVLLDFEGIMLVGDVYLNGQFIGSTDYGYLGFESDISHHLMEGKPNVIEVIANTGEPENSRWYTGGGLYRDVNIIITDPEHYFVRHPLKITTPLATPEKSVLILDGEIATFLKKDTVNVKVEVFDKDSKSIYSNIKKLQNNRRQQIREFRIDSISLSNLLLWDTENPNLYTVELTLQDENGKIYDRIREKFGFRTVDFSPEFGMKLNGKKVLLKGIANHHSLGALGAAAYPKAIEKRIRLLKEFGFNHVRTSHNPYSESFLDLCDQYGILVVDELYDKWQTKYAGGRKDWNQLWLENLPEWVRRDRNHPSVVVWSLGNELQLIPNLPYNDWGVTPYKLQKTLLNRYDTTRPVTVAMHPRGRSEFTDSLPAPLVMETDIAAYNYRYMYFMGDSQKFPWMIFYQSEANTSNMGPNFFEMDLDKVIGLAYWGMIDYLGESKGWPSKGWNEGIFDISLEPKPYAFFLKSYFKPEEPLVKIAVIEGRDSVLWNDVVVGGDLQSSRWNQTPGCLLNLYTYTNADEVELVLNGRSLGRRGNNIDNPKERNRIFWESIPYEKGYLEAVAFRSGDVNPIARDRIETSGPAINITAEGDNPDWKADGMDLQHVKIESVDLEGRRDYASNQKLKFTVVGPAEIVGVINGDITSNELTIGNQRSLYKGAATVILRSKQEGGEVSLEVSGENLNPVTLIFHTLETGTSQL